MASPSEAIVPPEVGKGLSALQQRAAAIQVHDADTCREAKLMQRDIRDYMKDVHSKLDPFVNAAKRNLQDAKDQLARYLDPAEAMDTSLGQRVKDFERREREAAEAETRRINEERFRAAEAQAEADRKERERVAAAERKAKEAELEAARKAGDIGKREAEKLKKEAAAAEEREKVRAAEEAKIAAANVPEVKVEANIPTVAGVPSRRPWKFRIVDAARIPRQYLIPDEVAIGAFVRTNKKPGQVIPGIVAYQE